MPLTATVALRPSVVESSWMVTPFSLVIAATLAPPPRVRPVPTAEKIPLISCGLLMPVIVPVAVYSLTPALPRLTPLTFSG
jgi:hypothetical protein